MTAPTRSNIRRLCRTPHILSTDCRDARGAPPTCSFCGKDIFAAQCLVSGGAARICGDCVLGFAELLTLSIRSERH